MKKDPPQLAANHISGFLIIVSEITDEAFSSSQAVIQLAVSQAAPGRKRRAAQLRKLRGLRGLRSRMRVVSIVML